MDPTLIADHPAERAALNDGARTVTYGELREHVSRCAGGLTRAGIGRDDRVAVLGLNDTGFVTGVLAAMAAGAAACPLSALNPPDVILERISELQPRAIIVTGTGLDALGSVRESIDGLIGAPSGAGHADVPLIDADPAEPIHPVEPHDPAVILHTSGIIGEPRATVLTHHNLHVAQRSIAAHGPGIDADVVTYGGLSFAHVLGLNQVLFTHLRAGARLVLDQYWDAAEALELIRSHRITSVVGVPPMWNAWARLDGVDHTSMSHVTHARSGASNLHADISDAIYEQFGVELMQSYGLTETSGTVTIEPNVRRRPGSVGRPLSGVEIRVVDNEHTAEPGDRGEVWIRTASIFAGYLNDPLATADVLVGDGWCRTGDIGVQDDDGTLYLVGRSKDLINVSGFNVFPAEVEAVLEQHPSVRSAVVIGEAHPVTSERVVAYVIADREPFDAAVVIEHCRSRLSRYKVPATIRVVDHLPLTSVGKRRRADLRDQ
jgi:long-chain acyl-CoA synthetase